ncbi:iron ABC transporter permease [uncultured Desulfuromusa sp.]|uniref:FecCD family ABC transporter permease n=1 Tax=uncultured Desulfuromusa sp. TaxID=219183 RepID=UPI002AA94D5B|nr:iron ABC transporter permease [uncultured Desulfuromusa sp.]
MDSSFTAYRRSVYRQRLWLVIATLILLMTALVALLIGPVALGFEDFLPVSRTTTQDLGRHIIWQIRMPRICGAMLGGAGFSVAGMVLQTILRNPLASPSTLGISQGAAFGAACGVIILGLLDANVGNQSAMLSYHPYLISSLAFAGALATTTCIALLATIYRVNREMIILAGVALSAFFMAGTTILQYFADETQLASIVSWTFGDVGRASWSELKIMVLIVGSGLLFIYRQTMKFNALLAGTDAAGALGVSVVRLRLLSITVAALMTAIIVTFFGVISFVGLVAPHMARIIVGEKAEVLLPMSALLGALLLLGADLIGRLVLSPVILPAGVITAFMGTPIFFFLLFGGKRQ